jgi:hypothetical protein
MADVCTELLDFEYAARVFAGLRHLSKSPSTRSPALYTDEVEATADAQARLDARDGAARAQWVPLRDLRPGATFETQDGGRFLKTAESKGSLCVCYDLEHGQRSAGNVGAGLVREIKV